MRKLESVVDDITELKVLIARQEGTLAKLTVILEGLATSVDNHIRRSDAIEDMVSFVRDEQFRLKQEHELTKQLLLSKIESETVVSTNKNELLWTILKTVFYTLSSVGAILLALKQLEIFDKLF